MREEAFRSRESHRKHPRRRGPSSISSLRLSMTSRRRKYHAVREVQSCGPDVWSRSQSFPDSQKFSITSLFDNTLLSVRFSIGRSVRGSGKRASRLVTAPPPFVQPETAWTIRDNISFRVRETSRGEVGRGRLSHVKTDPHLFRFCVQESVSGATCTSSRGSSSSALLFFFFCFCTQHLVPHVHPSTTGGYRHERGN